MYTENGVNKVRPTNIQAQSTTVTFDGQMSKKTFDTINEQNLVSHSLTGATNELHCTSERAAARVVNMLAKNED